MGLRENALIIPLPFFGHSPFFETCGVGSFYSFIRFGTFTPLIYKYRRPSNIQVQEVSTHLFQHIHFRTLVSIHIFQHICFNKYISTYLFQHISFNTSISTHLSQHICFNTSISTHLSQHICFNTSISTHLSQHICLNTSVSTHFFTFQVSGSKAPQLKYLGDWLKHHPSYDVDSKWAPIIAAKVKIACVTFLIITIT